MSRKARSGAGDGADYTVGYGRPPEGSRFKPGQSGNPRGRPKAQTSTAEMLAAALTMSVSVTENGQRKRMSALALLFRSLVRDALRGNKDAVRSLAMFMKAYPFTPEMARSEDDPGARVREKLDRMAKNLAIERARQRPAP
jgi:hypothetical protein